MHFYLQLATARRKRETAHELTLHALATQGDAKSIKKQLRELKKDA